MKTFVFVGLALSAIGCPAFAASLDGRYSSNMGNTLTIRGNTFQYKYNGNSAKEQRQCSGTLTITSGGVQFNGTSNCSSTSFTYSCTVDGPRLWCNNGARVWLKGG